MTCHPARWPVSFRLPPGTPPVHMSLVMLLAVLPFRQAFPAASKDLWDARLFDYDRPPRLAVQESTPAAEQVAFLRRPPPIAPGAADPVPGPAAIPRAVGAVNIVHLRFRDAAGELIPALLCTPRNRTGPWPLVIAIHGFLSHKAQVCYQVAPALVRRGYAVLAADMPFHGERPGNPKDFADPSDLARSFPTFRQAVVDVRQLIDLAQARRDIDAQKPLVLVGYSMGSWIAAVTGPADPRVNAMVLMVGGAPEVGPGILRIPQAAALDPRLALAHFAGRPVLLLNGRNDTIVPADWSHRLFAACQEPKKQLWYDCGHFLPAKAFEDAADWIASLQGGAQTQPAQRGYLK